MYAKHLKPPYTIILPRRGRYRYLCRSDRERGGVFGTGKSYATRSEVKVHVGSKKQAEKRKCLETDSPKQKPEAM